MKSTGIRKSIHSTEHEKLREFWKSKRQALGLSQRAFAKIHGYDYSLISKIERGDRRLDSIETIQYCLDLEIDPHEAITYVLEVFDSALKTFR